MKTPERESFIKILNSVRSLYEKPQADATVIMMWWAALERFDLQEVRTGFNRAVQDPDQGQFLPKPADVIRNIEGNSEVRAEHAWTKVDKAVRTVGPYQTVLFDDRIIHAVMDGMGGWIDLCNTDEKEYPFKRVEFVKRYRGFSMNPPDHFPRKLLGKEEHEFLLNRGNFTRGKAKLPNPVVIGDVARAQLVYESGSDSRQAGIKQVSLSSLNEVLKVAPVRQLADSRG